MLEHPQQAQWVQAQGALCMTTSALSLLLLTLLSLIPVLFRSIRHMHAHAASNTTNSINAAAHAVEALLVAKKIELKQKGK